MRSRLLALAARLRAAFASPRVLGLAVVLAAVLSSPVLVQGLQADDHVLRGFLLRTPPWDRWAKSPLDLFCFYDGDVARTTSLVDHGFTPWWTDQTIRIMFFRPLSALTHWVDFRFWPEVPALMHAQSIAWYLALVAVTSALYRRVLGAGWVAGLCAVLYAIDHTHGSVVEWISNRNALVAGAFGMLSLLLHDRARGGSMRRTRAALLSLGSAVCLALALAGGEVALGAVAYLVAHALFLDRAPLRSRIAALAPHLAVLATWVAVYRLGGFGAHGSGVYVDPAGTPGAFLRAVAAHLPFVLQTELGGFPPDVMVFLPRIPPAAYAGALALVGVSLVAFWPLRDRASARFFFTGALLSAVLVCGIFPAGRLLLLPGFGLLGLVALVVEGVVDRTLAWRPGPARACAVFVAAWVGGGHLTFSPLTLQVTTHQMVILERIVSRYGDALGEDPTLARQRVVIVNTPDTFFSYYILGQRLTAGRPTPGAMLVLASGRQAVEIERVDARSVRVRSEGGFYGTGTSILTRSLDRPVPAGTRFPFTGLTIEVTRSSREGIAEEAIFAFDQPLEDEALRWVEWKGLSLVPFAFPAVGQARRIEAQVPEM